MVSLLLCSVLSSAKTQAHPSTLLTFLLLLLGLQSFKKFLDDIVSDRDRSEKLEILQQYLDSVKPRQDSEDAVHLSDIMEMWSFAVQVKNESVMSSVPVVLALILQTVSNSLELVPHGLGICQTLLQDRQLQSLSSNLSAEKSKAFIISPTLRMLREAVCLDGGVFAKRIFRARASTFASLGRNLRLGAGSDAPDDARKSTIRTNAIRFLLSCLKYVHSEGRREFLSQRDMVAQLTFMIKSDPPYIILEILETLKSHLLMDDKIPRDVKFKSFGVKVLVHILGLYTYGSSTQTEEEVDRVQQRAHDFLVYLCTTPGAGILYPTTGLYPKPRDGEQVRHHRAVGTKAEVEGGLGEDDYNDGVPIFNFVLSEFAQKLRPWSSLRHNQLLVAVFKAAPELVADYFHNNRSFTFEPKLSMTWIGYGAFLFDTMQTPLPPSFGDKTQYALGPPPTSILLDNIIPPQLNQKTLIRCLSSKSDLTSFFAIRLLVLALEKLSKALVMLGGSSRNGVATWTEASRRIVDAFCQRIPEMKEIVRTYKGIPADSFLRKTLCSRLLRLYYEIVPRMALAANFDVSPLFVDVLRSLYQETGSAEAKEFAVMELENLVAIAGYSPGMRWFAKVDNIPTSSSGGGGGSLPFTALIKLLCDDIQHTPSQQVRKLTRAVAMEAQLITKPEGLAVLLQALRCATNHKDVSDMTPVWSFLDSCISRCASSPIKYLELLETEFEGTDKSPADGIFSLLDMTMAEQLSYVLGSSATAAGEKQSLARFLSLYFNAVCLVDGTNLITNALYTKICKEFSSASVKMNSLGSSADTKALKRHPLDLEAEDTEHQEEETDSQVQISNEDLEELLHLPLPVEEDTSALVKWSTKNVEDLIEDGWAARLVRLLASEHINIRKEAVTNILKMAAKIKESSYEEKDQVWLLLSEVAESSAPHVDQKPVPSAFTAFASHALEVLRNPLHPLYPKINTHLTRSPVWPLDKIPLAHDILHGEPSEDDRYYTELTWLLTYLLDSLVTPSDLGVFRSKHWFEKILALGANPHLRFNLKTRILRLVYRATTIEAGSTTLVTRFGIISWLDAQRALCTVKDEAAVFAGMMRRVWDTCDQAKVKSWSRDGIPKLIEDITRA
jgi:nucleolar pre-ribosomal-associated protein 1